MALFTRTLPAPPPRPRLPWAPEGTLVSTATPTSDGQGTRFTVQPFGRS